MLSIAIPSRNERFLRQTILDVLANATGEIEIFPVLDGYEPPAEEIVEDSRVHYLRIPLGDGKCHKRQGINMMVDICQGEYVVSLDAHCMVAKGFDTQLTKDHQPNWVQVPRRQRLDAENWSLENWSLEPQSGNRLPIDYEYIMWPMKFTPKAFHGFRWDERTLARKDIAIDEAINIQGSMWFMTKDWFKKMRLMQVEGYLGWGQEGEEISFKTWTNGGKVMVNKNTWYAHLHKGRKYGRMYHMSRADNRASYEYSWNVWKDNPKFHELIKKFHPMPGWPNDWENKLK